MFGDLGHFMVPVQHGASATANLVSEQSRGAAATDIANKIALACQPIALTCSQSLPSAMGFPHLKHAVDNGLKSLIYANTAPKISCKFLILLICDQSVN